MAEALKSIGYATALFGKWHLGGDRPEGRTPAQQGFDEYYGEGRINAKQAVQAVAAMTP